MDLTRRRSFILGKSAADVNLQEAAILAGLLKAPSKYSPHNNPGFGKEACENCFIRDERCGVYHGS